jgi:hypothetical protein
MTLNNDIDAEMTYMDPLTMKEYPMWLVEAVDQLLLKIRHKDVWEICDFAISVWAKKHPIEHKKFLAANKNYRESRKKKTGATDSNFMRNLVHVPPDISYILNLVAQHKIEDYGTKKFWREFARRYQGFSNVEKV